MNRITDPIEILSKAKDLISDPAKWTTGASYRDAKGRDVSYSAKVCSFCAIGAINAIANPTASVRIWPEQEEAFTLLQRVIVANSDDGYISAFNDNHTHAEVLAMFDLAIKNAKELQNV